MKKIILGGLLVAVASQVFTLDTLAQSFVQKFHPSDPSDNHYFGAALDFSGDLAIVADDYYDPAYTRLGAAYVFRHTPGGWVEEARLVGQGDDFGSAVAICGDHAAVGAPTDSSLGGYNGTCAVYHKGPTGWTETGWLYPQGFPYHDDFGAAVALRGRTLAVGAPRDEQGVSNAGGVWIYELNDTLGWVLKTKLFDPGGQTGDAFGAALALDTTSNRLAVGAQGDDAMADGAGAVHVFERQAGQWVHVAELLAPDGLPHDGFGEALTLDGDTLFVGAPHRRSGMTFVGRGYFFERTGGSWGWSTSLVMPSGIQAGFFGEACSLFEDRLVVGLTTDSWIEGGCGSALVYRRHPAGWLMETRLLVPDGGWNDQFGRAVAIEGNTVLVTAWNADVGGSDSGAAYEFRIEEFATPYCFCESIGPCNNHFGAAGCSTSQGWGGQLLASGSDRIVHDDLVLTLQGLPTSQFGLVYMGRGTNGLPFGDGLRCIDGAGTGVYRYPVFSTDASGWASIGPGLIAHGHASFPAGGHIDAGETWNFQGWFRDPTGPCGSGFNLTNGVAVSFSP